MILEGIKAFLSRYLLFKSLKHNNIFKNFKNLKIYKYLNKNL